VYPKALDASSLDRGRFRAVRTRVTCVGSCDETAKDQSLLTTIIVWIQSGLSVPGG
jgi:hypothetical protein